MRGCPVLPGRHVSYSLVAGGKQLSPPLYRFLISERFGSQPTPFDVKARPAAKRITDLVGRSPSQHSRQSRKDN